MENLNSKPPRIIEKKDRFYNRYVKLGETSPDDLTRVHETNLLLEFMSGWPELYWNPPYSTKTLKDYTTK
jgi:hypothetical protein